jgi:hypothetical protein
MKILAILLTFISFQALSAELKIEPVYGVERTQKEFPKPARYVTETFLGVRGLYGVPLLSLELELNQSLSKEDFPADNLEVIYTSQKALLGVRSYPIKTQYVGIFFRAGARAQKQKREITENSVKTTEDDALKFDPYAGTGLTLAAGNNFALNAGATLVYNRNADASEQYDTRYTFSFTIKAGNK